MIVKPLSKREMLRGTQAKPSPGIVPLLPEQARVAQRGRGCAAGRPSDGRSEVRATGVLEVSRGPRRGSCRRGLNDRRR